jgi:hypothetical protein
MHAQAAAPGQKRIALLRSGSGAFGIISLDAEGMSHALFSIGEKCDFYG